MKDEGAQETGDGPGERPIGSELRLPSEPVLRVGLLVLIAFVFLPTLDHAFVYDDGWTLRSNGFLREFDLGVLFSSEAVARHVPDAFRPTQVIFDAASYALLGLRPWAHHAVSILLHLGVCTLVFRLMRRMGAPLLTSAATTLIFGVLAIHAEAIAVVSYREDLLAAFLGLGSLLAVERSLKVSWPRAMAWLALAFALEAAACGAKMSAAMLPLFRALCAGVSPWRSRPAWSRIAVPALVLAAAVGLVVAHTAAIHGALSPYDPAHNPRIFASRVGLAPVLAASTEIHVGYLRQVLVPLGLSPEYVDYKASWGDGSVVAATTLLATATAGALVATVRGRGKAYVIAGLGFLLLAIPTSNIVGMPNMRADRFMYLPSLPLCMGLAVLCLFVGRKLARKLGDAHVEVVPALALAVMQGSFCLAALTPYENNMTLWEAAVERAPDSARAQALVGLGRLSQARGRETIDAEVLGVVRHHCVMASRLDPIYELPELCHAELALAKRDWSAAHGHFTRALEHSPDRNDRILGSLAQVSLDLPGASSAQRADMAHGYLQRGMSAYPYSPEIHATAARIAHQRGDADEAMKLYRRARSLRPERWETVVGGLELALDLGDAPAAYRTWFEDHEVLGHADPATRAALRRRLIAARRTQDFTLLQSLCRPGVFPDEP